MKKKVIIEIERFPDRKYLHGSAIVPEDRLDDTVKFLIKLLQKKK